MAPVEAQIFGIGRTGLAHPEPVETQQGCQGGLVGFVALGREEEPTELSSVEATSFARVDLGTAGVLRRIRWNPAVDVGEAVEPADGRQPPVDRRGGQSRSSLALRQSSICARVASSTSRPTEVPHN